jgi:hypothetical protein
MDKLRELGAGADENEAEMADLAVQLADFYLREGEGGRRYYYDEDGVRHPSYVLWQKISDVTNKWQPDTVRTQERYARLIPRHVRDEYDMFTWTHHKVVFDACKSDNYPQRLDKHVKELDMWLEKAHEHGGNIASVRVMKSHYTPYDMPAWRKAAERLLRAAEAYLRTDCEPEDRKEWKVIEFIAGIVVDKWPQS